MLWGRFLLLVCVVVAPCLAATSEGEGRAAALAREASLRDAPQGSVLRALVVAGAPLTIVAERDGWLHVRVEGWIPAASLASAEPAAAAAPAPPAGGPGSIAGSVSVDTGKAGGRPVAGVTVYLLPREVVERWEADSAAEVEQLAGLEARAADLRLQAGKALRESNFTEATRHRDELMRERREVLDERQRVLEALHGRHELEARSRALATTASDAAGRFELSDLAAGDYAVYARLQEDDQDTEWVVPATVTTGRVVVDLD